MNHILHNSDADLKSFLQPTVSRKPDDAGIAHLPPLPASSYEDYVGDFENHDLLDLDGAEGKVPSSLKQTILSLKQFAKRKGQAN